MTNSIDDALELVKDGVREMRFWTDNCDRPGISQYKRDIAHEQLRRAAGKFAGQWKNVEMILKEKGL